MSANPLRLLYVADPMCSWCWGFAPVLQALEAASGQRYEVELVLGGLRPGPQAEVVDGQMKAYLRHHWEAVHERSGQPFNFNFFARAGFLYDTDPPSRAAVAVRRISPDHELRYFHRLQAAFYAHDTDITATDHLTTCAEDIGLDAAEFRKMYDSPETLNLTHADYERARGLGVTGFPSVILQHGRMSLNVMNGWLPIEDARQAVEEGIAALTDRD